MKQSWLFMILSKNVHNSKKISADLQIIIKSVSAPRIPSLEYAVKIIITDNRTVGVPKWPLQIIGWNFTSIWNFQKFLAFFMNGVVVFRSENHYTEIFYLQIKPLRDSLQFCWLEANKTKLYVPSEFSIARNSE